MNLKCYVVDDEPHCIELIAHYILKMQGFELIGSAINPLIALEEIKSLKPDIAIIGIGMPEMSGIELANHVDHISQVVLMSGDFQSAFPNTDWKNYIFLQKATGYTRFLEAISELRDRLNSDSR